MCAGTWGRAEPGICKHGQSPNKAAEPKTKTQRPGLGFVQRGNDTQGAAFAAALPRALAAAVVMVLIMRALAPAGAKWALVLVRASLPGNDMGCSVAQRVITLLLLLY